MMKLGTVMKRSWTRIIAVALLCATTLPSGGRATTTQARAAQTQQLNVLLIVVDDLNTQLGCYGNMTVQSPNIDRLAKRGVRFERAYAQFPVCNPSRNSFLSGLRPTQTGVLDNSTPLRAKLPNVVTLPQLFRQNGWFTASIAKIFHVSQWDPPNPVDKPGTWKLDDALAWDYRMNTKPSAIGQQGARRVLPGMPAPNDQLHYELVAEGNDDDQEDGEAVRKAIALMSERRDKPFFIGVGMRRPHAAWVAPKKYFDLYPRAKLRLPAVALDERARKPAAAFNNKEPHYGQAGEIIDLLRAYYASLTFMDAQVGRLMAALDQMKLWDNTVVVLLGDHGFHLGEHGLWHKGTLFEESTRAPLVIVAPGAKGNSKASPRIVEFVDLYPTLADLCGLRAPTGLAGRSLRPLLDAPMSKWDSAAFSVVTRRDGERPYLGRTVRTTEWRYTEWDEGRKGAELYDHRRDAGEQYNLVGDPKFAGIVARLKERLQRQEASLSEQKAEQQ